MPAKVKLQAKKMPRLESRMLSKSLVPPPPRREKLQAKKMPRLESRTLSKSSVPLSAGASTVVVSSDEGDEEPVNDEELAAYLLAHIEEPETPELQSDESSHKWCDGIGSDLD